MCPLSLLYSSATGSNSSRSRKNQFCRACDHGGNPVNVFRSTKTPRAFSLRVVFALAVLGASTMSCKGFETNLQDTEVDYQTTARQNYESGTESMEGGNYNEAIKFFEYVKNKFPYSKYAVLADLRVADAHFEREKWLEAADAYRLFFRFHPRHDKVPYAMFRVGLAYSHELDEHWLSELVLPPQREKDQTAAKDAIRAVDEYLTRFPADENVDEAKEIRVLMRTRLADHDMYAADFYAQREKWKGAILRYETVAKGFSDTPHAPTALLAMARIYEDELEEVGKANKLYQDVVERYPDAKEAPEAKARALATLAAAKDANAEAEERAKAVAEEKAKNDPRVPEFLRRTDGQ